MNQTSGNKAGKQSVEVVMFSLISRTDTKV